MTRDLIGIFWRGSQKEPPSFGSQFVAKPITVYGKWTQVTVSTLRAIWAPMENRRVCTNALCRRQLLHLSLFSAANARFSFVQIYSMNCDHSSRQQMQDSDLFRFTVLYELW